MPAPLSAQFPTAIGEFVGGGSTVGSLLFIGAGQLVAQDNANLFWNNTNKSLTVVSTSASSAVHAQNSNAGAGAMSIRNTNASGPVDFYAVDSGGTARLSWGYGNASYSDAARASRGYVWRNAGVDFVFARTSVVDAILKSDGKLGIGTATTLDGASTVLLHVNLGSSGLGNSTTNALVVLERNANVYLSFKKPSANECGLLFSNTSSMADGGVIYDTATLVRGLQFRTGGNVARMDISSTGVVTIAGVAATNSFILTTGHVSVNNGQTYLGRDHATDGSLFVHGTNAGNTNPSAIGFLNQAGSFRSYAGYFPSLYAFTHFRLKNGFFCQTGEDFVVGDGTDVTASFVHGTNRVGIGIAAPATNLHVFGTGLVSALGTTQPTFEGGFTAQLTVAQSSGNWGIAIVRAANDNGSAHLTIFKTRSTDPSAKVAAINGDNIGDVIWQTVDAGSSVIRGALIEARVNGTVAVGSVPTDLLFYTATTTVPVERLRLASDGGLMLVNSSAAANSAATEVRLRNASDKLQASMNGGGYFDVATYATALTTGSVLFANGSNQIAQDNARFFWNDTNKVLQLSTNHATTGPLNITATAATAPSAIAYFNHGGAFQGYMGWFNNLYGGYTYMREAFGVLALAGQPFVLGSQFVAAHVFATQNTAIYYQMYQGGSAAVAPAATGRIQLSGTKFQISTNTGAYFDIGTYAAALTAGSILFANGSNQLAQDNANLFWDDTNNRLGIGTNVPGEALHVVGNTHITGKLTVDGAIDPTSLTLEDGGNAAYFETADGQSAAVSPANRGRIRYNVPSQTFQLSLNGTAYADIGVSTPDGKYLGRQVLTASSGTYTPTAGCTKVILRMAGGGGGGGAKYTLNITTIGGGGAAGMYVEKAISPGVAITGGSFAAGAGGAGGDNATGGTGGDTTIVIQGTTYTAKGGLGGTGAEYNVSAADGGAGQSVSQSVDVQFQEPGDWGFYYDNDGSAFANGSGKGGNNPLGCGGASVVASTAQRINGNPGQGYGGGGSGALDGLATGGIHAIGGDGADGVIIVDEFTG